MKHLCNGLTWGLAVFAVLLSPVVLIFSIPLIIGMGLDIFALAGEGPVVVALCAPLAVAVFWRTVPCRPIANFVRSRLHLGHAAGPHYAP